MVLRTHKTKIVPVITQTKNPSEYRNELNLVRSFLRRYRAMELMILEVKLIEHGIMSTNLIIEKS